jgi:predicted permease
MQTTSDIRYALRSLRRTPALAVTVLLTFALGIGITTAMFSVVHGMLLRPLPYSEPDRIVRIWEEHPGGATIAGQRWLSNHTYKALNSGSSTLEAVGAFSAYDWTVRFGDGDPIKAFGSPVSPAVFRMLGAAPALGRFFDESEAREGAHHVVVIGDRLWRDRFGAAPDVLGRTFAINGDLHTIVGVARPTLEFPDRRVQFWVPNTNPDAVRDPGHTLVFSAIARLRPGATPEQAESEATSAARAVTRPMTADMMFGKGGAVVVHVRPLGADISAPVRPAILVVTAAVVLLLLIACANIANLLLSRGIARERELVIRAAVGASRGRLARQLLTESATLSIAGGALGLFLAWMLVSALPALAPARLPRIEDVRVDLVVLTFGLAASLVAGLIAGLAPALRSSRVDQYQSIREAGSTAGRGAPGRRLRYALLVAESAFAILLVVGAGLLARSFARLLDVDAGYAADGVLTARIEVPKGTTPEGTAQLVETVLDRVRGLPGVVSAGAGSMMPMLRATAITSFTLPETVAGNKPTTVRALTYTVTPGYAEALSMRLRAGRLFEAGDEKPGPRPVLVNEEFVRQYVTGPAVGRRLGALYASEKGTETEIVGVVGNVLKDGNDQAPQPEIYFVHAPGTRPMAGWVNFVIKTTAGPAALAGEVRAIVRDAAPLAVVERLEPLPALVAASVAQPRFGVTVVSTFAALAVVLAAVGLYGVLSYGVSQRRREMGVRAALGADRRQLLGLVLREALTVTAIGAAVGLIGAGLLTRLIQTLLFGISPLDPVTYATAPAVLLGVALVAGLVPALRAARTDPAVVLRD